MHILEHGKENTKTLLFFPCTAEPVWAFTESIEAISRDLHIFQVVYDGHQPEYPGDFTSVEQTVDEVIEYLKKGGYTHLDFAYGCSMGGACLTRFLSVSSIPVEKAVIDGGITPYPYPYLIRRLLCARDWAEFKIAAGNRKIMEAAFPPERFTQEGHDFNEEYDRLIEYFKTYSNRTVWRMFWSANNYSLPQKYLNTSTKLTYWYGEDEAKARKNNIRFITRYFPKIKLLPVAKMAHAELVMVHPAEYRALLFKTLGL